MKPLRVQIPSSSKYGAVYTVSRNGCSCRGFEFRGQCSHFQSFLAAPKRFVPVGEELHGLWAVGAETLDPHGLIERLDAHYIGVVFDLRERVPHNPLAPYLRDRGVVYLESDTSPKPTPKQEEADWQRTQAIKRMAQVRRVCVIEPNDLPWRKQELSVG